MIDMKDREYRKYSNLIYEHLGIYLREGKKEMVQAKVNKLMRENNIESYEKYYDFLLANKYGAPWNRFVDEITIHKTDFFRENGHFEFIKANIEFIIKNNPRIIENREIRVWSAGSSTGEEPYTIGIVLKESLPSTVNIKILATDVSNKVIEYSQKGIYNKDIRKEIDGFYLNKYFLKHGDGYKISREIRDIITFRTFNLMSEFPFKNTFDIVFCRNVMIYFNLEVQEKLIKKIYGAINPGGLFFIGHSESLTGKQYKFKYLQPTIYIRANK